MGDVSSENLGIKDVTMREKMLEEIDIVLHSAACTKFDERAKEHGWPNTYVFTKAMGEMLVGHMKENLPVIILRPTIVTSTYKEPFPGWIEGARTIDSFANAYGRRNLTCFPGDIKTVLDVMPADMVVNEMIVAMVATSNCQCYDNIYHVGSSVRNPVRYENLRDYMYRYLTEKPWEDKDGKSIKVGSMSILDMAGFQRCMFIRFLLPTKVLKLLNTIFCKYFQKMYIEFNRKIQIVMRLADLYKPYLFFRGAFDDVNMEKLRMTARHGGVDEDLFSFDPKMIEWEDYFMNIHFPGTVKFIFK
ncbi:hypothetical protein L6164_026490 [Bauhinia variegata]|uniref:Uncharacterized protein n=1 Tax=Bauhinia variegata TaxID=167791 RepID=A0ACB9LQB8_BAUVA|nr:hypothetical protein L6164_026490 [Bauhinia variegata]